MIQRTQTLWLVIAIVAALGSIKFPFYTGSLAVNNAYLSLTATHSIPILVLTSLSIALSLIVIFSFKNRKRQTGLTLLNILLAIIILILYFMQLKDYSTGSFSLASLFAFVLPVCLIMALIGIRKDVKVVKSLDRLR